MMKQRKNWIGNLVLALAVAIGFTFSTVSCKKEKPPEAEITVVDSSGNPIEKARVVLFCVQRPEETRECVIRDTQFTDIVGKTKFVYDNPAVLKMDVWKEDVVVKTTGKHPDIVVTRVGDTLCAEGFVNLEMDEVTEQTVIVNLCNKK